MKKYCSLLSLFCFAAISLRADIVYKDAFNYADGPIVAVGTNVDGTTNWFHTGGATAADFLVKNKRAEISATGGTLTRSEDVHCSFTTFTNVQTTMWASFTVICTNPPPAVGTYYAHFWAGASTFHARLFAQAGTLPGSWKMGVEGGTTSSTTPNIILQHDLATNVYYQVVLEWDAGGIGAATLWVNPISSTDPSVSTSDGVTLVSPADALGFGFRQASSFGNFFAAVTNLVVATTFDEAATNVWATNAVTPIIALQPKGGTNFVGDVINLISLAAGQGQGALNYQWTKNGANVSNPNGNTNVFTISSAVIADSGDYAMIATTPYGLSATTAVATLWVTNPPVPPTFNTQPTNTTVFYHSTAILHAVVTGPPPITYQWYYTNAPATGANVSGADSDTLTISDVLTNNGTTGSYYLVASNPYGSKTSSIVTVTAVGPPAVSISFLRTLVDPTTYNATNATLRWQATGIITAFTNLTTADTSSYYLQDATGGINIFVTHGHDFRPTLGDVVTFIGFLSSFNSNLELEADTNDVTTSFTVLSNNIAALPAAKVVPFNITNNLAFCETNLEGSIVMLTNVFFGTNAGALTPTNSPNNVNVYVVTNGAGETFNIAFAQVDADTANQVLPPFAWTLRGIFNQNLANASNPRNVGYQITVTKFSDIVTGPPPPVTVSASVSGGNTVLTWPAVAYDYSYTVLSSTNVAGPYLPLASGLNFTTSSGAYTESTGNTQKYYQIVSP
jgi:hypothetical protein